MSFTYGEYDGEPFPTPDSLFARPEVVQFLLMYGQEGLDALSETEEQQHQELIDEMIAAGLLEKEEGTGKLKMTPKMVRGMEHRSLLEIFANLQRGNREGHETQAQGRSEERQDGSKPYVFGDKLSDLDMASTLRNALSRSRSDGTDDAVPPLKLSADDLEVYPTEGRTDTALCILLDLSGSMMRYRRFLHAKQVALGMAGLIRRMFPQDTVDYVGFYSLADALREEDLPLVMPKPVSIFDHQVRMRMPLEQAQQDPANIPQHFTNLQLGLRQARSILKRRGAMNRQIFVITDGQPTAHVEPNASGAGEMLYLLYPPSERTSTITLKEALRCQQEGIRMSTFALVEDYWGMDWVGFVDQMTRLVRGSAFYCSSEDLSSTVFESYLSGKKTKSFIG